MSDNDEKTVVVPEAPTEEKTVVEPKVSAEDKTVVESNAPVEEKTAVEPNAPVEEKTAVEPNASVEEKTAVEPKVLAEDKSVSEPETTTDNAEAFVASEEEKTTLENDMTSAVEEKQQNLSDIEKALDKSDEASANKKSKVKIIVGTIVGLIAAAAIVFAIIFFLPQNRVTRALDTGYKFLSEEQWEEAIVSFDKAIAIDNNCIKAYAGELQAYVAIGDQERLEDFYEAAIDMLDSVDDMLIEENQDEVIELYLGAKKVYTKDLEKVAEILEEGLEKTGDNKIKEELVDTYVEIADGYVGSGDYEKALKIIDRLLELDEKANSVQECGENCLNKYMEYLFSQHRFDEIRALINKYKDKIPGAAYGDYLSRIAEVEAKEAQINALMQKVYDAMAAEDFATMCEIDGSDEAQEVYELIDGDNYAYIPSGAATGTGSVLCKFDRGYYFYYGDVANGVKTGNGIAFISQEGDGYKVMRGSWSGDKPNGQVAIKAIGDRFADSKSSFNSDESGTMINGLWDGFVDSKIYWAGQTFNVSFSATEGRITEDKTAEFNRKFGYNEKRFVFAYDGQPYGYFVWSFLSDPNHTIGWYGCADED